MTRLENASFRVLTFGPIVIVAVIAIAVLAVTARCAITEFARVTAGLR